jgi:serine/threonine protein kinase
MESVGRYELRGELGRGRWSVVYRAWDPAQEREVAIKIVPCAAGQDDGAREAPKETEFWHPNLVPVVDRFHSGDRECIVMELVRGATLEAMIAAGETQNLPMILRILGQTAAALDAAHAAGMVHGALEPGKVLLSETGEVKVSGFGHGSYREVIASLPDSRSWHYWAPERLRNEVIDGRTDQYALGVIAYQLLTGELPFEASKNAEGMVKVLSEMPTPASTFNPLVTPMMHAALERAMAKDRGTRFPRCSDFVEALAATVKTKPDESAALRNKLMILLPLGVAVTAIVWWMSGRAHEAVVEPGLKMHAPAAEPAPVTTTRSLAAPPTTSPAGGSSLALIVEGIPMDFAQLPGGEFGVGVPGASTGGLPQQQLLSMPTFQMGRTEVTEAQWNAVMTGRGTGGSLPQANVSWNAVQEFLAKLNARKDGFHYRLPSEAEWEYAARANLPEELPGNAGDIAWHQGNSGGTAHEIAGRLPNTFGLFDMIGNLAEWTAEENNRGRVVRGGSFGDAPGELSAVRRRVEPPEARRPEIGFRVLRERR